MEAWLLIYLQLAGGLVVLLLGGDLLVRGAVALARTLGVSPLVIGLTVVAFGTSAPELIVSVDAAWNGVPGLAIGNVVGSNVANVLLVLGAPAIVFPIVCQAPSLNRDLIVMIGASLLFIAFCWSGTLVAWHGAILVTLLLAFLVHSYVSERDDGPGREEYGEEFDGVGAFPRSTPVFLGFIAAGLAGLLFGSHLLIDGAVGIARAWGVTETVIGLTLVALGTSLPELATTVAAAIRRQGGIAVGNVVGSNMFNILGVMGVTALLVPVPIPERTLHFDLWVMLGAALIPLPFALRRRPIRRAAGVAFAAAYLGFVLVQYLGAPRLPLVTAYASP